MARNAEQPKPQDPKTSGPAPVARQYAVPAPAHAASGALAPPALAWAPMFLYAHHPKCWVVRGGKVVPQLAKIPLMPNINGARLTRTPSGMLTIDDAVVRQQLAREGYTVIEPLDGSPDGNPYTCRVGDGPDGTGLWVDRWTDVYPGQSDMSVDEAARDAWACSLVGVKIAPPAAYILRGLIAEQESAIVSLEPGSHASASTRARIKQHEAAIAVLEAALSSTPAAPAA